MVTAAALLATELRFGGADAPDVGPVAVTGFSLGLVSLWSAYLVLARTRHTGVAGHGIDEYRRIVVATGWLVATLAAVGLLLDVATARSYLVVAVPVGLTGLLLSRRQWRRWLARQRAHGRFTSSVLVIGGPTAVEPISTRFDASPGLGYQVVGVCIPGYRGGAGDSLTVAGRRMPILGDENAVESAIRSCGATTVAVAGIDCLDPVTMRRLVWQLERLGVDLVVAPGVLDVAGPRLSFRLVDNLAMLHVGRAPRSGPSVLGKRLFDLVVATVAGLAFLPVVLVAAAAVKLGDPGPVFYRQERVGLRGKRFRVWKLRTMVVGADRLPAGPGGPLATASVFHKCADDVRVTRVGRVLRRTSIDELPQLLNVLVGQMSLVGPRPLLPGEGAGIESFVERRGLVRPGMTGLWQVSGRSDLAEAERIRLDNYYIDNWSMLQDLAIVCRTARAVVKSHGAY
ncbi:sugar transferase [Skermania piniformis]|uniref:Sugar transferase n=1 Tax=Skermania pinensis TaxID=39122 RepID=A0ABX8SBH4_9ACTN|nr:sugar transferase [Skermania piniformis]QXQ15213.1 sugar transferase [Skermania piniformis]